MTIIKTINIIQIKLAIKKLMEQFLTHKLLSLNKNLYTHKLN
jgi:hypothetical protein